MCGLVEVLLPFGFLVPLSTDVLEKAVFHFRSSLQVLTLLPLPSECTFIVLDAEKWQAQPRPPEESCMVGDVNLFLTDLEDPTLGEIEVMIAGLSHQVPTEPQRAYWVPRAGSVSCRQLALDGG